jgi:hypothetical protein
MRIVTTYYGSPVVYYRPDPMPVRKDIQSVAAIDKEGRNHGKFRGFYPGGNPKVIENYCHGRLDGWRQVYDDREDALPCQKQLYHMGQLQCEKSYNQLGQRHGLKKEFGENKQLTHLTLYDCGKVVMQLDAEALKNPAMTVFMREVLATCEKMKGPGISIFDTPLLQEEATVHNISEKKKRGPKRKVA